MRLSEFQAAVDDEFGAYGSTLIRDQALTSLGGLTAEQALAEGESPREVWRALCDAQDVPEERIYGRGRPLQPGG